jgi:FkbM family methyltransferase
MEFTSQVGQDFWVCGFFNYKKNGFFLDVGAHNGLYLSNTLYLEKELGWKGICVEAGNAPYSELIKNRTCDCVHAFVSDKNEIIDFKEMQYGDLKRDNSLQKIQSITLDMLLPLCDTPKVIDYISIDTEGFDYKVLCGFPFDKYEGILWTIEHNLYFGSSVQKDNIMGIMYKNGYVLAKENVSDGVNIFEDWYINKKYVK